MKLDKNLFLCIYIYMIHLRIQLLKNSFDRNLSYQKNQPKISRNNRSILCWVQKGHQIDSTQHGSFDRNETRFLPIPAAAYIEVGENILCTRFKRFPWSGT